MVVNHDDSTDLRGETRSIGSIAFFDMAGAIVQAGPEPERVGAVLAGESFAETLGLRPALGRLFAAGEYLPNGSAAVILTYRFWMSHFAGDRADIQTVRVTDSTEIADLTDRSVYVQHLLREQAVMNR